MLVFVKQYNLGSLAPRLSPRANEKSKERGEPGRIYHVRNVKGGENLHVGERKNSPTLYGQNTVVIALWPTEWD